MMLGRSDSTNGCEVDDVDREIEGEHFPEEFFVMPLEAPVGLASVRPVNQNLAKRLTDDTADPAVGDAILQLTNTEDEECVITVWRVAEETYILEVTSSTRETAYFETTSTELEHELYPKLRTGEWSLTLLDEQLTDSLLDGF